MDSLAPDLASPNPARVIVVGGGVLGSMHAYRAIAAGHEVIQLEREQSARGASVRNFGLIWVSGRAPGVDLEMALRARELWERFAQDLPGVGFRANGSVTVVRDPSELAVLEQVCARDDAQRRGVELLAASDVATLNPALRGQVHGGLFCRRDAAVEPRLVPAAIRARLENCPRHAFQSGVEIVEVDHGPAGVKLTDSRGRCWEADQAFLCTGAWHDGVAAPWLVDHETPPVRRVRLQMMQTAPLGETVTTSVADADSLRYYPAYDVPALADMTPQNPRAADWAMQLLMVQRLDGGLTIGDTHRHSEPFEFDLEQEPYDLLTSKAERILGRPLPRITRRWAGVYSQLIPEHSGVDPVGQGIFYHREIMPGLRLVTGPGGRGMTHSPAIAERTLTAAGLL